MKLNFKQTVKVIGLTQKEFGSVIGVKGATITKYLNNPQELRIRHLHALAETDNCKQYNLLLEDLIHLTL